MSNKINILDCTLRDGSYKINFQFTKHDTSKITSSLNNSGIPFIEVGHGWGLGSSRIRELKAFETDISYILAAKSVNPKAKIGCFFIPGVGNKEDLKLAIDADVDFIRIGTEVDEYKNTFKYLKFLKSKNIFTCINLMKTYSKSPNEVSKVIKKIEKWKLADVVYIVDSAGCMTPNDVQNYFEKINVNELKLGFHGHNNLGLAVANSLKAVECGAEFLDCSIRGMGRSAGNAQTEILVHLLNSTNSIDYISPFNLMEIGEKFIKNLLYSDKGVSSLDVSTGMSKLHSNYLPIFRKIASDSDVNLYELIFEVSKINYLNPDKKTIQKIAEDLRRIEK